MGLCVPDENQQLTQPIHRCMVCQTRTYEQCINSKITQFIFVYVNVVVQFYHGFKFCFPLFWGYGNEGY